MAHEPTQRRNVQGSQPLRLTQPETGAAPRPWFGDDPAKRPVPPPPAGPRARPAAGRPIEVQPLSDAALQAQRQPNWLLEHDGEAPKAKEERPEPEAEVEESEPAAPETSYVEPETTTNLVSRALVPAGLVLVVAFLVVGGFAFVRSGGGSSIPASADPLDADPAIVSGPQRAELVAPPNSGGTAGTKRTGTLRPGAVAPAVTNVKPAAGSTPPAATQAATDTTSASLAPAAELRSIATTPQTEALGEAPAGTPLGPTGAGTATGSVESTETATGSLGLALSEEESTEIASRATELDELLDSLASWMPSEALATTPDEGSAATEPQPGVAPVAATPTESLTLNDAAPEELEPLESLDLLDQLFGAFGGGATASGAGSSFTSEVALGTEHATAAATDAAPAVESEGATHAAPVASDPLALGVGQEPVAPTTATTATTAPAALDGATPQVVRLDLDWEELTQVADDAGPTPTVDTPLTLAPTLDWSMDWSSPNELQHSDPTLGEPTLAGPTFGETAAVDLAPSFALERGPGADGAMPADSIGPEAPPRPATESILGTDGIEPNATALALEVDALLEEVGPRPRPSNAPEVVEPDPIAATEPTAAAPTEVVSATPTDLPVEVVPPVATPSDTKGLRSVLRRAGEAGTWTLLDVPNEVVSGPELLKTPFTGNVRVVFEGGDVFEGRLHAVGQNEIALDTRLGRMTLDGRRLQRIERLAPEAPSTKTPTKPSHDTSGLDEVRVTTRGGGVFNGHLVSRDGNKVTLIASGGYRMTVDAVEVTPTRGGRGTSTLRRAGDQGAAPVKPAEPAPPAER